MIVERTISIWKKTIDDALGAAIPSSDTYPEKLHQAMRHGVFPGGKRIRPLLVLCTGVLVNRARRGEEKEGSEAEVLRKSIPPAVAIELIHSYSLIHDDLPCMDNDDYRRGLPTVHRAFGEAEAILAGDALLSLAFEVVSNEDAVNLMGPVTSAGIVLELAKASGSLGMVGGQVMDISPVCRGSGVEYAEKMSDLKTGALMRAAVRCGAMVAGASPGQLKELTRFGELFGRAFQVQDDIHDFYEEDSLSFSQVLGIEEARSYGTNLLSSAIDILKPYEKQGKELLWLTLGTLRFS